MRQASRRRRRQTAGYNVRYVAPSPRVIEDQLEVVFFLQQPNGGVYNGDSLVTTVKNNQESISNKVSFLWWYFSLALNSLKSLSEL